MVLQHTQGFLALSPLEQVKQTCTWHDPTPGANPLPAERGEGGVSLLEALVCLLLVRDPEVARAALQRICKSFVSALSGENILTAEPVLGLSQRITSYFVLRSATWLAGLGACVSSSTTPTGGSGGPDTTLPRVYFGLAPVGLPYLCCLLGERRLMWVY